MSASLLAADTLSTLTVIVEESYPHKNGYANRVSHDDARYNEEFKLKQKMDKGPNHPILIELEFSANVDNISKLQNIAAKVAKELITFNAEIVSTTYKHAYEKKDILDKESFVCQLSFYLDEQDYTKLFKKNIYTFDSIKQYSISIKNNPNPIYHKQKKSKQLKKDSSKYPKDNYSESPAIIEKEQITELIKRAQEKANQYAESLDFEIGEIDSVEELFLRHHRRALKVTFRIKNT